MQRHILNGWNVTYKNMKTFILISHDIPFLNKRRELLITIWIITAWTDMFWDYDQFRYVWWRNSIRSGVRTQQEIGDLKDFVNRNKARVVAT